MGLRGILASTDHLEDPSVLRRLRALRDDAPVALEHPFWGAQFLAMAFGHELGFASAHPPALRSIFNLAAAAASADSSRTRPFAPPTVSSEASAS